MKKLILIALLLASGTAWGGNCTVQFDGGGTLRELYPENVGEGGYRPSLCGKAGDSTHIVFFWSDYNLLDVGKVPAGQEIDSAKMSVYFISALDNAVTSITVYTHIIWKSIQSAYLCWRYVGGDNMSWATYGCNATTASDSAWNADDGSGYDRAATATNSNAIAHNRTLNAWQTFPVTGSALLALKQVLRSHSNHQPYGVRLSVSTADTAQVCADCRPGGEGGECSGYCPYLTIWWTDPITGLIGKRVTNALVGNRGSNTGATKRAGQ